MNFRESIAFYKANKPAPRIVIAGKYNKKLKKDLIAAFNLVAGIHCPGKGECWELEDGSDGYCFASGANWNFPSVIESGFASFNASLLDSFVPGMIAALKKEKARYIRVHAAGDFYAQKYVEKWAAIAAACPEKNFYAYTKSLKFDFSSMPANVNIIQSTGGMYDALIDYTRPHARIFSSVADLLAAGYVDCSESDLPAALGAARVGLVNHGPKTNAFKKVAARKTEIDKTTPEWRAAYAIAQSDAPGRAA